MALALCRSAALADDVRSLPQVEVNASRYSLLGVADAAGLSRFAFWGYSWGGNVGLQLASRTDRLLLEAWEQGVRGAQALADAVWHASPGTWLGLLPEGGADEAAAREQALAHARHFLESVRPIWQRLGILQEDIQ